MASRETEAKQSIKKAFMASDQEIPPSNSVEGRATTKFAEPEMLKKSAKKKT